MLPDLSCPGLAGAAPAKRGRADRWPPGRGAGMRGAGTVLTLCGGITLCGYVRVRGGFPDICSPLHETLSLAGSVSESVGVQGVGVRSSRPAQARRRAAPSGGPGRWSRQLGAPCTPQEGERKRRSSAPAFTRPHPQPKTLKGRRWAQDRDPRGPNPRPR